MPKYMNKYDSLKFLKETKARILHICNNCNEEIRKGEIYYPESIGKVNALGIKLKKFCKNCYQKYGDKLLNIKFYL
jgi:uncharacterized protein with PIN domain